MSNHFLPERSWAWPEELRQLGVLGINARNLKFISERNERNRYPNVDNKLNTKLICHAHGIPGPETYAVLAEHSDVRRFHERANTLGDFVVKPASGSAGRGIIIVSGVENGDFLSPGGDPIPWSDLRYHLSTILSGLYSLGGQIDQAIVEQRIVSHQALSAVTTRGTPDVRVVLYRGVPVMAMIRLPTLESGGCANLHQGAIAAAVDLLSGETYGGVCRNRIVTRHPDTQQPIGGIEIPAWKELLGSAMQLSDALEMGYVGVDFVIDDSMGPVVLEANARPGLAIQVAHREGLLPRLACVDAQSDEMLSGDRRWEVIERMVGQQPSGAENSASQPAADS